MDVETVEAARRGDEDAFAQLVEPLRAEIRAHCYRMLGSLHDAEDATQEAMLRAWRNVDRFEGRSSFRTWLHTVASNVCLRELERRQRRVLPVDFGPPADPHGPLGTPLAESVWVEPFPDSLLGTEGGPADARYEQKESVELAFVAAVQLLPPSQRAVLILRDVLAFSAAEVAESLETTPAAVNSALQRARATVGERLPEQSQQATMRALGDTEARAIVARFVDAWERSDVDAVVALLTQDAILSMPPYTEWISGRDAVATFLRERPLAARRRWQIIVTRSNGQPALAHYLQDEATGTYVAHSLQVLAFADGQIADMQAFLDPGLPERFGLPATLG